MIGLIILLCVAAVLLTYLWWPTPGEVAIWLEKRRSRRASARQWREYKRKYPVL